MLLQSGSQLGIKLKESSIRNPLPTTKFISKSEYWIFLGILLTGAVVSYGQGPTLCWSNEVGVLKNWLNTTEYMLKYRFKKIKSRILFAYACEEDKHNGRFAHILCCTLCGTIMYHHVIIIIQITIVIVIDCAVK